MTNEQKYKIEHGLTWASTHIQEIESSSDSLYEKADRIEWQLVLLLDDVVLALPQAMRKQAQACLDVHKQMKATMLAEMEARLAERRKQKETSPESLATAG